MFTKEQPEIVTEEDVGNYITELHNTTVQPIDEVTNELTDVAGTGEELTIRT